MKTARWLLAVALAAAACGSPRMPPPELMRSLVLEVRAEVEGHVTEASAAATVDDARAMTHRHQRVTDDLMDAMGMEMVGLDQCTGPGMEELRTRHAEAIGELGRHHELVDAISDVDSARAEILRHGDAMRTVLDAMDIAVDGMECDP